MCATMAGSDRKDTKTGRNITVGALFLPPDGWSGEEFFVQSIEESWKAIGDLQLRTMRLGDDPGGLEKTIPSPLAKALSRVM